MTAGPVHVVECVLAHKHKALIWKKGEILHE